MPRIHLYKDPHIQSVILNLLREPKRFKHIYEEINRGETSKVKIGSYSTLKRILDQFIRWGWIERKQWNYRTTLKGFTILLNELQSRKFEIDLPGYLLKDIKRTIADTHYTGNIEDWILDAIKRKIKRNR